MYKLLCAEKVTNY